MRFIVFGAGAVGSLVGGHLDQAGYPVVLLGRSQHVERINALGLTIKDKYGTHLATPKAVHSLRDVDFAPDDVVLLTVKTQDTEKAAAELAARAPAEIPIFCLQNGVRGEEVVARRFQNVYGGMVALGARYTEPGRVIHFSGNLLVIGCYPRGLDLTAEKVGEALTKAGFKTILSDEVMAYKWGKLIINLSNAIYAITGLSILELRHSPSGRQLMASVWEEGLNVLDVAGIRYEALPGRPSLREEIEELRHPSESHPLPEDQELYYYPSTWQDLYLKRGETEVPYLNGEIVDLGKSWGIQTPLNRLLLNIVEDMAAKREPPGRHTIKELAEMAGEMIS